MKKILTFISEVKAELVKVTWPKRDEVIRLTLVVIVISAIVAGFVGVLDFLFTKLLEVVVK
ncbi:MAG: preprotein translocase subunit SecE [bacterium]|nr:preprotein translocase subunit SecE [bacterium]